MCVCGWVGACGWVGGWERVCCLEGCEDWAKYHFAMCGGGLGGGGRSVEPRIKILTV